MNRNCSISGTWAQQPLISTGGSQPVLGGSDVGDAPSSDQSNQSTTAASNTATGAAQAPVAQTPASAPVPPPRYAHAFSVASHEAA